MTTSAGSPLAKWYAGQRVFVTGHTGFKGTWLTSWLRDMGAEVTGFSLDPARDGQSSFNDAGLAHDVHSVVGDVRDPEQLRQAMAAAAPELVLHLAAQSLVRHSYQDPVHTFSTNVMGTAHLLDAVRHAPTVQAVVIVSSDKCYENRESAHRYAETDALGGHDPYSASKGCTEIVTSAYRRSFLAAAGIAVGSARAGNVIGGGDWSADRLVPDLMRAAITGEPVPIRYPDAVRPWQHVLDPLHGYLRLLRALAEEGVAYAEPWNFGPRDTGHTVRSVIDGLQACWPRIQWLDQSSDAHLHEAGLLGLNADKAAARLGVTPILPLAATVEWTAAWYRDQFEGSGTAATLIARDLAEYERRLAAAQATPAASLIVAPLAAPPFEIGFA